MKIRLNNEFALVWLEIDRTANGERLKIVSARTGQSCLLDPLMLEVLTWLPHQCFIDALATPFGPEPDLGLVPSLKTLRDETGGTNGIAEAGLR